MGVDGQPGWTRVSVTIDYLLGTLACHTFILYGSCGLSGNARSIVPDGGLSLARKFPPHQNHSNAIHAATPTIRPKPITTEISSTTFSEPCAALPGRFHSGMASLVHLVAVALGRSRAAARSAPPPQGSALKARPRRFPPHFLTAQHAIGLGIIGGHHNLD